MTTKVKTFVVTLRGKLAIYKEYDFTEVWQWQGTCPDLKRDPRSVTRYSYSGKPLYVSVDNTYVIEIEEGDPGFEQADKAWAREQATAKLGKLVQRGAFGKDSIPEPKALPAPLKIGSSN